MRKIVLKNIKVHNLKNVSLSLVPNKLVLFTGLSGSGKSSCAFDTLYVEGQRRYLESLSLYARKRLQSFPKPDMSDAEGLTPTISIEQKSVGKSPRSTVGTLTEIYDHLRLLYARVGKNYCPLSLEPVIKQSKEEIISTIKGFKLPLKLWILSPYAKGKKGAFKQDFQELLRKGFTKVRIDGVMHSLEETLHLDKLKAHDIDLVIDRLLLNEENFKRAEESITKALEEGQGLFSILKGDTEEEELFSTQAYCPASQLSYPLLEPQNFSFNHPQGMCPDCHGLGEMRLFNLDKIIDHDKSIAEDCCSIATSYKTIRYQNIYDNLARIYNFSVDTPFKKLSKKAKDVFLYGNQSEKKWTQMFFKHPQKNLEWTDYVAWQGVLQEAHKRYQEAKSSHYIKKMESLMQMGLCTSCKGSRLAPYPSETRVHEKRLSAVTALTIEKAYIFFSTLKLTESELFICKEILKEIQERLTFLLHVGLHYLSLDRTSPTLSGGEAQRVRLASQIGSGLTGITYVLDEPSIGLHPRDNIKLIDTLKKLRDKGNTVIVVEHDEETILAADEVVDFGPRAGIKGGEIVFQGTVLELLKDQKSLTGAYLSGRQKLAIPPFRREKTGELILKGATHHNLKKVTAHIPLGIFLAITGVSGSGKSSLILETLYPALENILHKSEKMVGAHEEILGLEQIDKVIGIDQSPIGRTPRSNPATYIKLFDHIRDLFSSLKESEIKGFSPGRFSFNVKEGSCLTCSGMGQVKIDMDFMEDQFIDCPTCKGKRFDEETLSVYFKGKNIHDVLEMEVKEALSFFKDLPPLAKKLETLARVGMDYIKLGQFSTTLSGGEAQRIKLAKELSRPETGHTLYILDEPTTGLHLEDIAALLKVLQELVDKGNTVIVIEHNMEVVKMADHIIDIGPDGGDKGGEIVATGTPEKIAQLKTPTGIALKKALHINYKERLKKRRIEKEERNEPTEIVVEEAHQNNLKNISVSLPRGAITICTGPSGSGKSSFAVDTLYAEGQRRYVDSMSAYARQFVHKMDKPQVKKIEGLSPAILIEQQVHAGNPRSTLGTQSEIYDYIRLLYAHIGIAYCPETGEKIESISKDVILEKLLDQHLNKKAQILSPLSLKKGVNFFDKISELEKLGFVRVRLNHTYYTVDDQALLKNFDEKQTNTLEVVVDRIIIQQSSASRILEALEKSATLGENQLLIALEDRDLFFNLSFSVPSTGKSYKPLTPHSFSFNSEEGMCKTCDGIGSIYGAHLEDKLAWEEICCVDLFAYFCKDAPYAFSSLLKDVFDFKKIDLFTPFTELTSLEKEFLLNGGKPEEFIPTKKGFSVRWIGLNPLLASLGKSHHSQLKYSLSSLLHETTCPECKGARLHALARHVKVNNWTMQRLCEAPLDSLPAFFAEIRAKHVKQSVMEEPLTHIENKLNFLLEVGLSYLTLDRKAPTLSGGETQRIRLARQLGSGLTGVLYVLDEPTIGLHPHDILLLNKALHKLKNLGNTLVLVEHDPLTIQEADYILDFGPAAGDFGGEIIAKGSYQEILNNKKSITGDFLSGRKTFPPSKQRKLDFTKALILNNLTSNNLKKISFKIPLSCFTCLTGVSGSGKSTIFNEALIPAVKQGRFIENTIDLKNHKGTVEGVALFEKCIILDQNPIGLTIRSDVSSYVDLSSLLRAFFALLPDARTYGLAPKHFSPNHKAGMCTECRGLGFKEMEMYFMPSVKMSCPSCKGLRLNPLSLKVTYKDKNVGQWLNTSVRQALIDFETHPRIAKILTTLTDVGLDYLLLGQKMATLSLGEAQRIKLSKELSKRSNGKTLYLLDEPTTGLHSKDVLLLVDLLQKLVDKGNTIIAIEHNIDFIRQADYIVDLGPHAGINGGEIVASGTVNEIKQNTNSLISQFI
jgi:excinuclease ABC subunit A